MPPDQDDSKDLAVLKSSFADLVRYIMGGHGVEGKISRLEREQKEAIAEIKKDTKQSIADVNTKLERIEERLGRVITIIAWSCGAGGVGIGAFGKWFIAG